ncbi:MAG: phosphate ABC transporter permease PstA [Myxococcota bacterium]|nr:phosphate ABC transporter permease PstA [Myxococcota bacterium]
MRYGKADWVLAGLSGLAVVILIGTLLAILVPVMIEGVPRIDGEFLTTAPSSDLVGGGVWPAIFGTMLLTVLMTIAVVPVGVATGVYLSEYASRTSGLAKAVRASVHNLAGVPSIVFGLFGLGFFVLFLGRGIDAAFYGEDAGPVWGQPAVLWSSLTLAVLTLPVVIVTTEEALRSVPQDYRLGSLALGATRFQTIWRVVIPNATGGILTGVVLAVSRGAGEVAPIIFTGAANFLPYLPTDMRDMFMHLGYHVFALSTQSPNVDAARPTLFATVAVLLVLTFALNLIAIVLRIRTRKRSHAH